jgi:cytochrome c-type biogenesis protein CcmF
MLIAVGQLVLLLAMLMAALSGAALVLATVRRDAAAARVGRDALVGCAASLVTATGILLFALLTRDVRLQYVARYTDATQPLIHCLTALWAGAEGSLLLWATGLAVVGAVLAVMRPLDRHRATCGAVLAMVTLLLVTVLNVDVRHGAAQLLATPFAPVKLLHFEGSGMALSLQTSAMILHPPALFAAYVALAVAFAIAVANLATGRLTDHLVALRRWLLAGWILLTVGNALGAWWAYAELGWGGYWSWDPVENASLVPWLVATAALHTMAVTRRTRRLAATTLVLIAAAFLTCLLATYITRSGITNIGGLKTSVHAYTAGDAGGQHLIVWLVTHSYALVIAAGAVLVAALILRHKRRHRQTAPPGNSRSRRFVIAMICVVLVLSAFAFGVLYGTLWPAISVWMGGEPYQIETSQYDLLATVLGLILLGGLAAGMFVDLRCSSRQLRRSGFFLPTTALLAAAIVALAAEWRFFPWLHIMAMLAAPLLFGQIVTAFTRRLSMRNIGVSLAHIGFLAVAIGICGSHLRSDKEAFTLEIGQSKTLGNATMTLRTVEKERQRDGQHELTTAVLDVRRGASEVFTLRPALRIRLDTGESRSEMAVRNFYNEDVCASLGSIEPMNGHWPLTVHRMGTVIWLWIGSGILTLAGIALVFARDSRRQVTGEEVT